MIKDIALGLIISLLFICLVIIFCAVIVKLYIKKIKEYNLKELAFQKTLNSAILETQEQLLNTISQDLHDDAGQQLTVINFQLENLKLDFPDCEKKLVPVSKSVEKLSQSLRQISHSLNKNWLLANDLNEAIAAEIIRIRRNKKTAIVFNSNGVFEGTDNEKIVVFRIFQETINNILKHAKASKIEVTITTLPIFKIIIKDNGIGFEPNKPSVSRNTIGIQNCYNRAKIIDYDFNIHSEIEKGTWVTLSKQQK